MLEALRIEPDAELFHYNVAAMFSRKGQTTEAIHHYSEAIRLNSAPADAHYRVGLILADRGNVEEAARHFETALKLNPRSQKVRRALDDLTSRRGGTRLDTR